MRCTGSTDTLEVHVAQMMPIVPLPEESKLGYNFHNLQAISHFSVEKDIEIVLITNSRYGSNREIYRTPPHPF